MAARVLAAVKRGAGEQTSTSLHMPCFDAEPSEAGMQMLVPGVRPLTLADRLAFRAEAPLGPKRPQRPLDIGLFDEAALNQLELFGISGRTGP